MRFPLVTLLLVAVLLQGIPAANILGIFPTTSKSHYITSGALMKSLAAAGHNVTMISQFSEKKPIPNFRPYTLDGLKEALEEGNFANPLELLDMNPFAILPQIHKMGLLITNFTLTHPKLTAFLADPSEHFDVVICEVFVNEAMLGLGQHFNAPVIGFSTFGTSVWTNELVGTPSPLSYVPHTFLSFNSRMSFAQRLGNTLMTVYQLTEYYPFLRQQAAIYDQIFGGPNKPTLQQVRQNVSLVLLNQHVTLNFPQPYAPNMIEVGGIHINRDDPKPLPENLRTFIEGAEHGVVYFSMGSIIQGSQLPVTMRDDLLRAFGKLKQRVLWKWDILDLPGKPENVLVQNWFPQDDILAHPNVKLFVTHGGLLGMSEAVYHGLPVLGIPVFGDQYLNLARAKDAGFGLAVAFDNVTEKSLTWGLGELLNTDKYSLAAKTLSSRFRDQPLPPLELAKYWVEYVIRHKGAPHLHSAGQELHFIAYHNLDVFALIAGIISTLAFLGYWIISRLVGLAARLIVRSPTGKCPNANKKRN